MNAVPRGQWRPEKTIERKRKKSLAIEAFGELKMGPLAISVTFQRTVSFSPWGTTRSAVAQASWLGPFYRRK